MLNSPSHRPLGAAVRTNRLQIYIIFSVGGYSQVDFFTNSGFLAICGRNCRSRSSDRKNGHCDRISYQPIYFFLFCDGISLRTFCCSILLRPFFLSTLSVRRHNEGVVMVFSFIVLHVCDSHARRICRVGRRSDAVGCGRVRRLVAYLNYNNKRACGS